ncbi:MAG TPA: hypothetical protein VNS49_06480 [Streptomyces sp.]|nr:hypothetical protein [Streptomyces sp.]
MKQKSKVIGVLGAAVLTAGLLPATATASPGGAAAALCGMHVGSVSAGGDHQSQHVSALSTPDVSPINVWGPDLYPDGQTRFSASLLLNTTTTQPATVSGYQVIGDALYRSRYVRPAPAPPHSIQLDRIGGGWGTFVALDESRYQSTLNGAIRTTTYGLRNDGLLFRWTVDSAGVWRNAGSAPGFASVKSMALISKTPTYDTFLANTRAGALYTIHIPTSAPMKPVVKAVRGSTWQGFEYLIANKCGSQSTLLIGIDKDTQSAHMYAVSHAQGTSTVIKSLGKLPATFDQPIYFRWAFYPYYDQLFGE